MKRANLRSMLLVFGCGVMSLTAQDVVATKETENILKEIDSGDLKKSDTLSWEGLDRAEVKMPYRELQRLWELSQRKDTVESKDKKPLLQGSLLSAQYVADMTSGILEVEAEYRVESFSGEFEKIKLAGAGIGLSKIEPSDVTLIVDGPDLYYVAKDKGTKVIRVWHTPQPLSFDGTDGAIITGKEPWLKLSLAPCAVMSLQVKGLPEGYAVRLNDKILNKANDGTIMVPVSLTGDEVALFMTSRPQPKQPKPLEPPKPSEWGMQNNVLVYEGEGGLQYHVQIQLSALGGSALEAVVLLPNQIKHLEVTGEDLAEHHLVRRDDSPMELHLRWHTRDIRERAVKLEYVLPQLLLEERWDLKAPTLIKEDRVKSVFLFPQNSGYEFVAEGLKGPIPARNLPKWILEQKQAGNFWSIESRANTQVARKLLPRLETASTLVTKAEFSSRLVGDGSMLTEGIVHLEHEETARWLVTLPEKAQLLKCSVNGELIRPVERGNGTMEIGLDHNGSGKEIITTVTLSYTETKGKLNAVEGSVVLELPLTPLFMNEVLWNVLAPETYQLVVQGNMEQKVDETSKGIGLIKKLVRNERPTVELFYRRKGLD